MAPSCVMPFGTGRFVHNYSTPLCGVARSELRSEEHTSELQSQSNLVCRLLLEKKKQLDCACIQRASQAPPPPDLQHAVERVLAALLRVCLLRQRAMLHLTARGTSPTELSVQS